MFPAIGINETLKPAFRAFEKAVWEYAKDSRTVAFYVPVLAINRERLKHVEQHAVRELINMESL